MKKLFLLLCTLSIFSCESPKITKARKDLETNPNWELADKVFYTLYSKPVREIFLIIEDSVKLLMPAPLLQGTVLYLQFDQEPPATYITDEKTLSIDISDKIHTLLRAQTLTLSGDLFNMGLQESLTIPVAHLGEAVQSMLILSKSQLSLNQFITNITIGRMLQNIYQNAWQWPSYRRISDLMRDFYFFPQISVCISFEEENGPHMIVYISRTSDGLTIKPILEFNNEQEAGSLISERSNTLALPFRARFDHDIVQTSLPQIDEQGKFFSLGPIWKYLLNAREMTARWPNENEEPITRYTYIDGLEYRLIQAYAAAALQKNSY